MLRNKLKFNKIHSGEEADAHPSALRERCAAFTQKSLKWRVNVAHQDGRLMKKEYGEKKSGVLRREGLPPRKASTGIRCGCFVRGREQDNVMNRKYLFQFRCP